MKTIIVLVRVLFVASEVAPFAKTGGLADVAGALPQALARRGHDVRIVMPSYDAIRHNGFDPAPVEPAMIGFDLGPQRVTADIQGLDLGGVAVTLIDVPGLFRRGALYTDSPDDALRFATLGRAALEVCQRWQWAPDIVHCNDWQTALIPLYLRTIFARQPVFRDTKTVLTIHNLAYQGTFDAGVVPRLGLDPFRHLLDQAHLADGWVGFLETGLIHADVLTTVSPTYAKEITTPEYGFGLDEILRRRSGSLHGILNGIDTEVWNPATDRLLPFRYSAQSLWRKEWNKRGLLESAGLEYHERVPVFGIVSRLVSHKGVGLLPRPLSGLLEANDARFVGLGTGDPELEAGLNGLVDRFPGKARFVAGYDEVLSHRIEGGVDVFLMPSQFEPSGLNQMYSLAYGTPPLVRRTGGLADTVEHWDPVAETGTGFVFEHYDEGGVWWALNQALAAMPDRAGWKRLQLNGMAQDNSWDRAAAGYERVYEDLVAESRPGEP